jgi:hypothetical protein
LPLSPVFQFDFRKAEHHTGHHAADGAAQVNLLGNRDHTDTAVAPVGQNVDPITLTAR